MCALVGLLIGACVMLLVLNVKGLHRPTEVRIIERDTTGVRDTVVIIHEFKNPARHELSADTLTSDSTLAEDDSQDLLLAYPHDLDEGMEAPIPSDVMLDKATPKVVVWNDRQEEIVSPDKKEMFEIQLWSTPFKNRTEYNFDGSVLKVKGVAIDNLKILRYKNEYYLISQKRVFPIHKNNNFERLVETHDITL